MSQKTAYARPSVKGRTVQGKPQQPRRNRQRGPKGGLPSNVILAVLCVAWLVPAAGLLFTSLRTNTDVAATGWWTIFTNPRITLDNYTEALSQLDVGTSLLFSLVIAIPTTLIVLLVSAYAAYAFAWMRFPGRGPLFLLVVALLVVPPQVTLEPMLRLFTDFGMAGSVPAVWIFQIGLSLPFGIFVLRSSFAELPQEILEAAHMDGASQFTTFMRIVLPVSVPAIIGVGILQFLWAWNDLLSPLIFLGANSGAAPITVQIAGMVQSTGTGENLLVASAVLGVVVPLIVFFALQRYFVRGVLEGSVKG